MARLVIVSNRLALPGVRAARAGGVAVAMREALAQHGGMWFGWSGEIAEKSSVAASLATEGRITFATVDLSHADHDEYYIGYANSTLWPLLHYQLGLMAFHGPQFQGYMRVNAYLAKTLAPLIGADDIIWVHDYHLIPLGMELRRLGVKNRIGFFLHTPLPSTDVLLTFPCHEVMMKALCSYDLVGFQTGNEVRAFLDYIVTEAGGRTLPNGGFTAYGMTSRTSAHPIGIDTQGFAQLAFTAARSPETRSLRESLAGRQLIVGVDRMDYSKGIEARFEAVSGLLSERPEYRGKFIYLQITPSSRAEISQYRALRRDLERVVGRVNSDFADVEWTPIRFVAKTVSRQFLAGYYRIARVGLVTPLRDGMNLVAKEYVAAQDPEDPGVLVLSRFAGAAVELDAALLVNPFDTDQVSAALHRALTMPLEERRERWERMMAVISKNTTTSWREGFLTALLGKPAPKAVSRETLNIER